MPTGPLSSGSCGRSTSTAYTPASACEAGLSMNSTCFESGDHEGITQQPPVVSWRSSGVGVGVTVGVGCGVLLGRSVGKAAAVGVAGVSSVVKGTGTLDVQAAKNDRVMI